MISRILTWSALAATLLIFGPPVASQTQPDSYNFRGENFCLVEDARGMWFEGDPEGFAISTDVQSFKLTMGGLSDTQHSYFTIEGAGSVLFDGAYAAFENRAVYHSIDSVRYAWLIHPDSVVRIIVLSTAGPEDKQAWLSYKAKCFKAK